MIWKLAPERIYIIYNTRFLVVRRVDIHPPRHWNPDKIEDIFISNDGEPIYIPVLQPAITMSLRMITPQELQKGKMYCVPSGYTTRKDVFVCIRTEVGIEYAVFMNGEYPTDLVKFYSPSLLISRILFHKTQDPKYNL